MTDEQWLMCDDAALMLSERRGSLSRQSCGCSQLLLPDCSGTA